MSSIRALFVERKKIWTLAGLGASVGLVVGFALPLATSQEKKQNVSVSQTMVVSDPNISLVAVPFTQSKDEEIQRLEARNRRLEVMLATLKKRRSAHSRAR